MLIRTSMVAIMLLLSGCGNDPVSTSSPLAESLDDANQEVVEDLLFDEEFQTESGLLYQVLIPAEGPKPSARSLVTVHYVGALTDGTVFDSSYRRNAPSTFDLNGMIEGFTEGLQLMSVGSRYRFTMNSDLAYGDYGKGELIGPGETLVFEVELLEINSI